MKEYTMFDDKLLANMFSDRRFFQSSSRRYKTIIDGVPIGVVVALRGMLHDNFALNEEDFDALLKLKHDGTLSAAFVVLANVDTNRGRLYVTHFEAETLHDDLAATPAKKGPYGLYWLLRPDRSIVGAVVEPTIDKEVLDIPF
jgi:hypothetical protein